MPFFKAGISKRYAPLAIAAGCVLMLSGCLPDFFQKAPEYRITGIEKSSPLADDMNTFLEGRLDGVKTKSKTDDDLQREAAEEANLLGEIQSMLYSKGYYDAKVTYTDANVPWKGDFAVAAGAQYTISHVSITPAAFQPVLKEAKLDQLRGVLDAKTVLDAQGVLYRQISDKKCLFTLDVDHGVTLDTKTKKAVIEFIVSAGPEAKMDAPVFKGNDTVHTSYLQNLVKWRKGDCFNRSKIENLRSALFETGLFSSADIVLPEKIVKNATVPVTVNLKERAMRSIRAGLSYYSDEGIGTTFGWTHRNLLGHAENFTADLKLSQKLQSLETSLSKPYFLRQDQSLSFTGSLGKEDTDGYRKTSLETGAALKRQFNKRLSGTTGVSLSLSRIDDEATNDKNNYILTSLPQTLTYDSRDNKLDATKGWLLDAAAEPFFDAAGEASPFCKVQFSARTYQSLGKNTVAAMRVKAGSILGTGTTDVPATERFYSGGGGSVRGFGYQEVGPVKNGQPEGGKSVAEISAEMRFKLTDTFGVVAFADGGNVDEGTIPSVKNFAIGGGLGMRYYTDFGPLRFDVAVPLTRKEDASSGYQLYISIGQAF